MLCLFNAKFRFFRRLRIRNCTVAKPRGLWTLSMSLGPSICQQKIFHLSTSL